ncbi:MAG TPA: LysM peptidoglycan-binding domain-containing protein [Gammaproteobacteria bacterium]|nr:LysM peptidoglycan-binding domain-containing protein [Gammaproteobacteria bacterium]
MNDNDIAVRRRRRFSAASLLLTTGALTACQSFGPVASTAPPPPAATAATAVETPALAPIDLPALDYRERVAEPDLLARVRSKFALPPSEDPAIVRERDWYARNQAYLDRVFARAEPYLYHIVEALEQRGMPAELALLPVVESAFDPFAYSHGRAAGLWQIIPGTGRRLGLEQNWWFDGRRDILESTRAALDYLQELHSEFNGDWLLAVAGYNSGEGNVERAIRSAEAAGKPTDFWGVKSYLPVETRTYVPRLLAIAAIVAHPDAYGVALPTLANEPRFSVIDTGGQIDMALAAKLAGVDTDQLYTLNPGVNRWATDPDGPHRLLVPTDQAERFSAALASLGERERVQWTRHRIAQGENIAAIAARYDTTPAVIREVNKLRSNNLRAGDYLMIPHATQALASYTQSADLRAERQKSVARSGVRKEHVVGSGETLWSIARQYGVDVRALASWNAMAPGDVLSLGRSLVVWTDAPATGAQNMAQARVARTDSVAGFALNDRVRQINYVVRSGDSLSAIGRRFHVTVPKLTEWNAGAADKPLRPGQRLTLFVDVTEQSN